MVKSSVVIVVFAATAISAIKPAVAQSLPNTFIADATSSSAGSSATNALDNSDDTAKLSITPAPENFPVNKDVQMRSSNVERGTKISFPISANEISELLRIVNCLSIFSPVEIILNGSKFARSDRVLAQV